MGYTTNLAIIKDKLDLFTWGSIVRLYTVGPYDIVEYHPWKRSLRGTVFTGEGDADKTEFHVYVDGKSTSHGFGTLDAALAGAIAYRIEGPNHAADRYFIRSIRSIEES